MEFWGEEVKPGMMISCEAGDGYIIHLSQAALGATKKGSENVIVSVKVGDKKLVLGTLSAEMHPQIMCDLIFDTDFELSHSSKTTSVFLCGYKSELPYMPESDSGEDEGDELETDEVPMKNNEIEKSAAKVPAKDDKKVKQDDDDEMSSGDDDFSDSEDSEMSEDESSGDDELSSGSDDFSEDSEDENDDSEAEAPSPKKVEVGKKRSAENALKTPSGKVAKTATPSGQKTGDKKGVHVATPHPVKQASKTHAEKSASKTPVGDKKSKEKSPKSGSHACKSCSKTFGSEAALQSHQKAKKHEA